MTLTFFSPAAPKSAPSPPSKPSFEHTHTFTHTTAMKKMRRPRDNPRDRMVFCTDLHTTDQPHIQHHHRMCLVTEAAEPRPVTVSISFLCHHLISTAVNPQRNKHTISSLMLINACIQFTHSLAILTNYFSQNEVNNPRSHSDWPSLLYTAELVHSDSTLMH